MHSYRLQPNFWRRILVLEPYIHPFKQQAPPKYSASQIPNSHATPGIFEKAQARDDSIFVYSGTVRTLQVPQDGNGIFTPAQDKLSTHKNIC